MKNLIIIVIALIAFSCNSSKNSSLLEPDTSSGSSGGSTPPSSGIVTYYWLTFRVICSQTGEPLICKVDIYKNHASLSESGNTVNTGWYYSGTRFSESDICTIVLKSYIDGSVLFNSGDITIGSNPNFFTTDSSTRGENPYASITVNCGG